MPRAAAPLSVVVTQLPASDAVVPDRAAAAGLKRCRAAAGPGWEGVALCRAVKTGEASACVGPGWLCELSAALSPAARGIPAAWLSHPRARAAHAWLAGASCDSLSDPAVKAACQGAPESVPKVDLAAARALMLLGARDKAGKRRCPALRRTPSEAEATALCLCRELAGESCGRCFKYREARHAERCPVEVAAVADGSGYRVSNPLEGPLHCRVVIDGGGAVPATLPPGAHRISVEGATSPPRVGRVLCMPQSR